MAWGDDCPNQVSGAPLAHQVKASSCPNKPPTNLGGCALPAVKNNPWNPALIRMFLLEKIIISFVISKTGNSGPRSAAGSAENWFFSAVCPDFQQNRPGWPHRCALTGRHSQGSSLGPGQTETTGGDQPPLPSSPFKPGQHLGGDTPRLLIHLGTECRPGSWQLGGPNALLGLKGAEVLVAFTAVTVSTIIPQGRLLTSPPVLHRSERRGSPAATVVGILQTLPRPPVHTGEPRF